MEKSMSMAESPPAKDPQNSGSSFLDMVARVRREQAADTRPTTEKKLKNPFRILGTLKRGEFGNVDEGDMKSLIAKRTALSVGPSVVGLTSRAGDEFLLNCSGFVIDRNDVIATIITSASLVIGDEDSIPNNITVKVHLPNRDTVSGSVSQVDLHHNIATIIVSAPELRAATLLPYAKPFTPGKSVVALGRHARSFNLLAYHGELKHKDYDFDSEDVLSSGCKITHYGIGGPLVDIPSGLVIGMCFSDMNCTVFLPSTILLRCLKHFKSYGKLLTKHIKVHLPNRDTVSGSVSHVDLHHNVATITVSVPDLRVATLLPNAEPFSIGSVVALSRHAITSNLQAFHGEVLLKDYDIDSEDVLSSSCSITHYGIGGPLIDTSSGSIIGMCFSDSNCTVFLPNNILLSCLKHFKSYGKVFRPWLGMRTQILDTLKLAHLETIYQKFPDINGIFVEKVIKGSPADAAGVLPGDIITHCDQISVCSPLAFVEILFDKAESTKDLSGDRARDYAVKKRKIAVEVTIRRENISSSVNKGIIVDRLDPPEHNRWPLRRYSELKF